MDVRSLFETATLLGIIVTYQILTHHFRVLLIAFVMTLVSSQNALAVEIVFGISSITGAVFGVMTWVGRGQFTNVSLQNANRFIGPAMRRQCIGQRGLW